MQIPSHRDGFPACAADAPVGGPAWPQTESDQAGEWATSRYEPLLVRMIDGTVLTPMVVSDPDTTIITRDSAAHADPAQRAFARLTGFGWQQDGLELTTRQGRFIQLQDVVVLHDGSPIAIDDAVPQGSTARDAGRPADVSVVAEDAAIVGRRVVAGTDEPTTVTIDELFATRLPETGPVVEVHIRHGVIVSLEELPGQPKTGSRTSPHRPLPRTRRLHDR